MMSEGDEHEGGGSSTGEQLELMPAGGLAGAGRAVGEWQENGQTELRKRVRAGADFTSADIVAAVGRPPAGWQIGLLIAGAKTSGLIRQVDSVRFGGRRHSVWRGRKAWAPGAHPQPPT